MKSLIYLIKEPVERLLEFVDCESVTGENICAVILKVIRSHGLQPNLCRAQMYDGAGNMAGQLRGCASRFLKEVPQATYYHCASHQLNLAISKTTKVNEIQSMLSVLTSVGLFYKYSPKRQRQLEVSLETYNSQLQNTTGAIKKSKLKTMCQTRWIEQHTCMEDFDDMYTALCMCLNDITGNSDGKWDGKAVTEAQGLRHSISTPGFISAFKVNLHVFGFTKPLSILLQGSTMDIITAYDEIHVVKKIL